MGKFKDEHGESRIGKLLRNIGRSDILQKAATLVGKATGIPFLNSVSAFISEDKNLSAEIKKEALELYKLDLQDIQQERVETTKRWGFDMNSDSWLSKNVRPIVLLYSWLIITILVVADIAGAESLNSSYITLIQTLCLAVNVAYFGGRELTKITHKIRDTK